MSGDGVGEGREFPVEEQRWERNIWFIWHGCFTLLVLAVLACLVSDRAAVAAYVLLGVICLAYVGPFRPKLWDQGGPQRFWYLATVVPATLALGYVDPNGLLILYAIFPHVFALTGGDWRVRVSALGGLAAGSVAVGLHHEDLTGALAGVGSALLLSLIMGVLTQVMMHEAERRGELIRQLEVVSAERDEAHRQAGVLAERERLSHEIHDTLAQGFTSLLMIIQAADSTVEKDPATTHERLALAERTARESLAEARSLVAALAPAALQGMPLDLAIARVTARIGEELGVAAEARILGTPRELPADVQVVLLRATQESLANVRKHAAAASVDVTLHYREHSVLLEVGDDGTGFTAESGDGSFGLRGMRARVEQVSGTLEVQSAPGAGTTVRVEIP